MQAISELFLPDSKLAKTLPGFAPRAAQTEMAAAVARALDGKQQLVVEAETGTGKTYAYLVPVLMNDGKAIISTGTKNLQEQLFHRDLPALRDAIAPKKVVALLKGRSNYLCLHRMKQATAHSGELNKTVQSQLVDVRRWAQRTDDGDIGSLSLLQEDAEVLPQVTSTADNCLGRDCPDYEDCYVVKARKRALEADLVVVNHHLFFADMVLKDVGFGELIPEAAAVIFDEAHQLPDIASQYFGESVSSRQLQELAHELKVLYLTELKDLKQLDKAADKLLAGLRDWRLVFPADAQKGNWRQYSQQPKVQDAAAQVTEQLEFLQEVIKSSLGRHQDLDQAYDRCVQGVSKWQQLQATDRTGFSFWFETTVRQVTLHQTPLRVADKFGGYLRESNMSWIFTSATLAVGDDFSHFTGQLGLEQAATLSLPSPFDFAGQALLCMPRYLPQPHERSMQDALLDLITQVLDANRNGGTFVLFTSHRMLQSIAVTLSAVIDRPLFVQGTTSKRELLNEFIAAGNGVLLGTSSFWEGVDVRGDALRCVIIDKLPFASPDDPLLQARVEDCKLRGVDAFAQVQLPQAVITLKQGAGRLIRDAQDKGVLFICDQRLVSKGYGGLFLSSLPAMPRTRSVPLALQFLRDLDQHNSIESAAEKLVTEESRV
ncbi:ATP-dependent helicase [Pseudidiomarina salinarum]|uniref:DNA 5'-3' helicase n=1 Tax=Pseudidiomarina salinarum TaxID=435908 RepID=A0A094J0L4_9GAMM|nr:ATP-dependent DNA helicase [Pseudidiomarina salinarum]KFZ31619.1 ATP-dependent helicase [Pseudidiomarina salinarum]RUO70613.1 ATP-dependent DNA helicase [Pseudidiomarina salinarum]